MILTAIALDCSLKRTGKDKFSTKSSSALFLGHKSSLAENSLLFYCLNFGVHFTMSPEGIVTLV
jgi:hypothetical protein